MYISQPYIPTLLLLSWSSHKCRPSIFLSSNSYAREITNARNMVMCSATSAYHQYPEWCYLCVCLEQDSIIRRKDEKQRQKSYSYYFSYFFLLRFLFISDYVYDDGKCLFLSWNMYFLSLILPSSAIYCCSYSHHIFLHIFLIDPIQSTFFCLLDFTVHVMYGYSFIRSMTLPWQLLIPSISIRIHQDVSIYGSMTMILVIELIIIWNMLCRKVDEVRHGATRDD